MTDHPLDPSVLLNGPDLRLTLHASLKPASGLDRFQPAGFPEIGHVIYDAPRPDDRVGVQKICIVDSAASMANHLETQVSGFKMTEHRVVSGIIHIPAAS